MKRALLIFSLPLYAWASARNALPLHNVDFARGTVETQGAGAPNLHAPSAEVGRVQAERTARKNAEQNLRKGLAKLARGDLGCAKVDVLRQKIDEAIAHEEVTAIDWGADGSVMLTLRFSFEELKCPER